MSLYGKTALVTGGTSGIGEAIVRLFAVEGVRVFFTGRDGYRGRRLEIETGGKYIKCDVAKEKDIQHVFSIIGGYPLDVLVNNAAMFYTKPLEATSEEDWDEMFAVNTKSYFLMTKYALPLLKHSVSASVINNASVAGLQYYGSGMSYAYSASKAAVIQFGRIMALNYAKYGIRVNNICPGIIQTPVYGKDMSDSAHKVPLQRIGKAKEVAHLVAFLASDNASYITGTTIPIDGGLTI